MGGDCARRGKRCNWQTVTVNSRRELRAISEQIVEPVFPAMRSADSASRSRLSAKSPPSKTARKTRKEKCEDKPLTKRVSASAAFIDQSWRYGDGLSNNSRIPNRCPAMTAFIKSQRKYYHTGQRCQPNVFQKDVLCHHCPRHHLRQNNVALYQ